MTKTGVNRYQYEIPRDEKFNVLMKRQKSYFYDTKFIFLFIIERPMPMTMKYRYQADKLNIKKTEIVRDMIAAKNTIAAHQNDKQPKDFFDVSTDPRRNVENELRLTYPAPTLIPQQLINKHYNRFMDQADSWVSLRAVKKEKLTPIAVQNGKGPVDHFDLELIVRPPLVLVPLFSIIPILFLILEFVLSVLTGRKYYYPAATRMHRLRPVLVIRLPLFPFLLQIAASSALLTLILHLSHIMNFTHLKGLAKSYLKVCAYQILWKIGTKGNSVILSLPFNEAVNRILDPIGEAGTRYHYLYDEVFRADNTMYNYGGFHRNQLAPDLLKLNREQKLDLHFQFGFLGVVGQLFKSFNPNYRIVK